MVFEENSSLNKDHYEKQLQVHYSSSSIQIYSS